MSEWSIEHAWKAKLTSNTEARAETSTGTPSTRVRRLAGRSTILGQAKSLVTAARNGMDVTDGVKALSATLLGGVRELSTHRRIVISVEGGLQQVPFELLEPSPNSRRLLDTHVVSYTPSAAILTMLRTRAGSPVAGRMALAVGASPEVPVAGTNGSPAGPVTRGAYDLDATQLRPLPLAAEEAESVRAAFGAGRSQVLVKDAATEAAIKSQPLVEYSRPSAARRACGRRRSVSRGRCPALPGA
jgi:CHAT domain-containing protein